MQRGNVFSRICVSVCLCVCSALTFESLVLQSSFSVHAGTSSKYLGQVIGMG